MELKRALIDPSSGDPSMSRICLGCLIILDVVWTVACLFGIPPIKVVMPVSSMLGTVTAAVCTVYGVNSFGGAWRRWPRGNGRGEGEV